MCGVARGPAWACEPSASGAGPPPLPWGFGVCFGPAWVSHQVGFGGFIFPVSANNLPGIELGLVMDTFRWSPVKYITYTTTPASCSSPPKRTLSPEACPRGWGAAGPRPHARPSNPDESPQALSTLLGSSSWGGSWVRIFGCRQLSRPRQYSLRSRPGAPSRSPQTGSALSRKA